MPVELLEHRPAQGRLAGTDLASHLDESLALADAVKQVIQRLAVLSAVEKKARVRREVERCLLQAIKLQIHAALLAQLAFKESQR